MEDSSLISGVQISSTQNEDPAVSSISVFPSLSFAPATSAFLAPGTTSSSFFNLSYKCAVPGNVGIVLHLTLLAPDSDGALVHSASHSLKCSKNCAPTSCDGLCNNHGLCNTLTALCECEPDFALDLFCSFSFVVDKTEVCSDEEVTLTFGTSILRDGLASSTTDW